MKTGSPMEVCSLFLPTQDFNLLKFSGHPGQGCRAFDHGIGDISLNLEDLPATDGMFVSSQDSYVDALTPSVMVLEGGGPLRGISFS